ncbi:MAG TPA: hypothetical protein DCG57_15760 [Candidatus Riflebacteria bacterium]|nr:hypothetical protein [Candidatus Riflebacteria bacterium]
MAKTWSSHIAEIAGCLPLRQILLKHHLFLWLQQRHFCMNCNHTHFLAGALLCISFRSSPDHRYRNTRATLPQELIFSQADQIFWNLTAACAKLQKNALKPQEV